MSLLMAWSVRLLVPLSGKPLDRSLEIPLLENQQAFSLDTMLEIPLMGNRRVRLSAIPLLDDKKVCLLEIQ